MIITNIRVKGILPIIVKIYPKKIKYADIFKVVSYVSYNGRPKFGFINKKQKTLIINLNQTEEEILNNTKSNTRNEIRRGIKENMKFEYIYEKQQFLTYYNKFASQKKLKQIEMKDLEKYHDHLSLSAAKYNDNFLAMHAHIIDENTKTVRLLYSASQRLQENIDTKFVGIANRFLHYMEFLTFKNKGLLIYDFAGINLYQKNKEEYGIAKFKMSFGGKIKEVLFLYSLLFYLFINVRRCIDILNLRK